MKRTLLAMITLMASGLALADECKDASTQSDLNQCTAVSGGGQKIKRDVSGGTKTGAGTAA